MSTGLAARCPTQLEPHVLLRSLLQQALAPEQHSIREGRAGPVGLPSHAFVVWLGCVRAPAVL